MKVLIAAGGTGGHIYPGLAIAKDLSAENNSAEILFVGVKTGMEAVLIPKAGYDISFVRAKGFRRKLSLDTMKTIGTLLISFIDVITLFKSFKPDIVIGTGGYICGSVLTIAILKRIPTLMHESNALPGVTTRLLAPFLSGVAVNFEDARKKISRHANIRVTGNPLRESIVNTDRSASRKGLDIAPDEKLVVAFFGSLGSSSLNKVIIEMLKSHPKGLGCRFVFGTGLKHYEQVMNELGGIVPSTVEIHPYLYDVDQYLAAADLAICRAGAMTTGELSALGVPSILIPSPYVTDNHQEFNARAYEARGASVVILENHLSGLDLYNQMQVILEDRVLRQRMGSSARKCAKPEAGKAIQEMIQAVLMDNNKRSHR